MSMFSLCEILLFGELWKFICQSLNWYSLCPKMIVLPPGVLCPKMLVGKTFWDRCFEYYGCQILGMSNFSSHVGILKCIGWFTLPNHPSLVHPTIIYVYLKPNLTFKLHRVPSQLVALYIKWGLCLTTQDHREVINYALL